MILDTNALSAFAEGEPATVAKVASSEQECVIPVIVLGEFRFGIAQSRLRVEYERWLAKALGVFRVLDIDEHTSTHYAHLRLELKTAGTPIPANDIWIAALCRQHRFPILSQDDHFGYVKGLTRITW